MCIRDSYNTVGQTLGYTDDATDTRTPDLATQRKVSGIVYDEFGSLAGQLDTTKQKGVVRTDVPDMKDLRSDLLELTGIWAGGQEWTWSDFSDGEKTALLKGETVSKDKNSKSVEISFLNGSKVQLVTNLDVKTVTTRFDPKLKAGRLVGYSERVESTGGNLNRWENRVRENIDYDPQGRMIGYKDTLTTSGSTVKIYTCLLYTSRCV